MEKLKKTNNIDKQKNYLEDSEDKNLEDKKAKKEAIKNNYDFFIGFSMDKFDKTDKNGKPYIENGKIEAQIDCEPDQRATDDKFNHYKCATLQAIDKNKQKILTENYMPCIGYELDENDLIAKFFCWHDVGSLPIALESYEKHQSYYKRQPRQRKEGKKTYSTFNNGFAKIYCDDSKGKSQAEIEQNAKDFLQIFKSKIINRLERTNKLSPNCQNNIFNDKDSSDSSFDEDNYEINFDKTCNTFAIQSKHISVGLPCDLFTKTNGDISEKYNEICCFPKDIKNNKLSVKRLFVYSYFLSCCQQDQINNIVEVQLENFPTETIRVIDSYDMSFEMMSTEQFINTYVKDVNKKNEYLKQLENIKKIKQSEIKEENENKILFNISEEKEDIENTELTEEYIKKIKQQQEKQLRLKMEEEELRLEMEKNSNIKFQTENDLTKKDRKCIIF